MESILRQAAVFAGLIISDYLLGAGLAALSYGIVSSLLSWPGGIAVPTILPGLSAFVLLILTWLPGIRPAQGRSPAKLPARGFILIGLLLIETVVQGGIALLIPGLLPLDPTNNGLSKALFERVQG